MIGDFSNENADRMGWIFTFHRFTKPPGVVISLSFLVDLTNKTLEFAVDKDA